MKTINLSTKENKTFILSGISIEDKELLMRNKEKGDYTEFEVKTAISVKGIIKMGFKESAKSSNISSYVGYLKGYAPSSNPNSTRKVHYRDYSKTEQRQLENAHLIVHCSDAAASARTALKTIKGEVLVLWSKENS